VKPLDLKRIGVLPLTTNVRLKQGIPRAVTSIIILTFILQVAIQILLQFRVWTIDDLFRYLGLNQADPNPASWLTALFTHESYWHWFGNMLYLWIFGSILEDRIGPKNFWVLYLFCGFTADLLNLSIYWIAVFITHPAHPLDSYSLGASGAVSGIMGLAIYRFYWAKVWIGLNVLGGVRWFIRLIPWFGFSVPIWVFFIYHLGWDLRGIFVNDGIGHIAHIGGTLGGLWMGSLLKFKKEAYDEILWDRIQDSIALEFWRPALWDLEELEKLRPGDPLIPQTIADILFIRDGGKKLLRPEFREPVRAKYEEALSAYLNQNRLKEGLRLFERIQGPFQPSDFPEKITFLLEQYRREKGEDLVPLTADRNQRLAILRDKFMMESGEGKPMESYQALQDLLVVCDPQEMDAKLLEEAGETSLRVKAPAEIFFELLVKKGDERQAARALEVLSRIWIRSQKQIDLRYLHREAGTRLPGLRLYDEWVQLEKQLKS
jgi:membrane associated rhomboid family serine protease